MKLEPVVGIQPALFIWARQTIGLSVAEVAHKLKRKKAEIEAWESGESAPSYAQLEKLAYEIYKRPLAIFFLPEPPKEITPDREFRTLPSADLQSLLPDTYTHIRRAHAYQIALKELFENKNPCDKCIWQNLNLSLTDSVIKQAEQIRKLLGISLEVQTGWNNDEEALKHWRMAIEDVGVFIFKNTFKQKDISGFCLVDKHLPIIYLNNSTTKTRQTFSLLHELAHLLLSVNGLSKFENDYISFLPRTEQKIERFCNAIAAEVLIPSSDFSKQIKGMSKDVEAYSEMEFSALAKRYGVSREAILRRFLDQNLVSNEFYKKKAKYWSSQKKKGAGGNWLASANAYLSKRFAQEVIGRHYRHQLSLEQASEFLGIKGKNFSGLEQKILLGSEV